LVKKPWGDETVFAVNKKYAGKILRVKKGHRFSLQYHKKKDETMYLYRGSIKLTTGPNERQLKTITLSKNNVFRVPPKTIHRVEALREAYLIEVSTPQLKDVVRLKDDYKRVKEHKHK
jgi:mannose-6-phosphate isomerase